jgi:hypothetical protein
MISQLIRCSIARWKVLQKFNNHGGATTVYVTDYTANALVYPVQGTWCPPELHGRVFQCDMWDDARNIAKMMTPGEYWYLHNVRAKWSTSHYMEGTMQLAEKVTQLDETKLEVHIHLRALLASVSRSMMLEQTDTFFRRKIEFELNKSNLTTGSASSHVFPEMLLQDVEGSTSFLTCIVEVFHFLSNHMHAYRVPGSCSTTTSTRGTVILYTSPITHTILTYQLPSQQPIGRTILNTAC